MDVRRAISFDHRSLEHRNHDVTLREQAEAIWRAGVAAVDSAKLVRQVVHRTGNALSILSEVFPLNELRRIIVVGAGKAGAGMAAGLESALGPELLRSKVTGWINVPADCVCPLQAIHLHAARDAGVNEPTLAGVAGSERILELVASLAVDELCLVLISGGGSALLPAPVSGISLEDKLAVTRFLMQSGATIQELNTVRKRLSRIKGGGLLRAASVGRMISLIISDVVGDPLDVIASGPTVLDSSTAKDALAILERFADGAASGTGVPESVRIVLEAQANSTRDAANFKINCENFVIGNNQTALDAAAVRARELGYEIRSLGTDRQGFAREVGFELAQMCLAARDEFKNHGICFIGGGEPVVKLTVTDQPRVGGRNQEVALAAGCRWQDQDIRRLIVLSGGTDGEDGPTDAAGASFDAAVQQKAREIGLRPEAFLAINDSYTFFKQSGGLLKTGPTNTNVMDLQIALVAGADV